MEKLKMETPDMAAENVEKIAALFPSAVTEMRSEDGSIKKGIDFEMLKQLLSPDVVEEGDERYEFTWVGKRQAIAEAARPTTKTLRPVKADSRDWDTTENLYIEGDNLEVLKILQESYLGKVKMIYVDPPYNTGDDFIYPDSFMMDNDEYNTGTGYFDTDGNINYKRKNGTSAGRYHSDWCSMMYSRLSMARNLLAESGVIFISLDDNEVDNCIKICKEIFGFNNYITNFVWEKGREGGNDSSIMRSHYENILCFCKNHATQDIINLDAKDTSRHIRHDKEKNLVAGIIASENDGELFQLINLSKQKDYTVTIPLIDGTNIEWPSYAPQSTINDWIKKGKVFVGASRTPYVKSYLRDEMQGQKPSNIISQEYGTTKAGSIEIRNFFGDKTFFPYPKPSILIKRLLSIGSSKDSIILDFFSGSATTAHAVMQLNAEDGGHRKFIMVQLPEPCDEKSEAFKAGYKNICEIGKERIRRAGDKIKAEHPEADLDIGFRVFRVDESNMKNVYYHPEEVTQLMLGETVSNIKEDRTDMDLLYACLLDWGVEINLPHTSTQVAGCTVHNVDNGALAACFDKAVPRAVVEYMANLQPLRAVFRDEAFATDAEKINVTEIFKNLSPDTKVKVI